MTINRGKVVFLQTGTEPSYSMLYRQKISPQTEINTRRAFLDTIVFAMSFFKSTVYCFITSNSGHHQQVRYAILTDPSQHCHKFRNSSLGCCRRFSPYSEYSINIGSERLAQLCLKLAFLLYCIPFVFPLCGEL